MTSSLEGRILQSMAPSSNSIPYFPSTVNIMRYHSAIQLYYTAQLMSPEGNFLAGPDLILWTLKSKKVSQAGGRKKSERDLRFEKDFQLSAVFEGGHVRRNAGSVQVLRDSRQQGPQLYNHKDWTLPTSMFGSRFLEYASCHPPYLHFRLVSPWD